MRGVFNDEELEPARQSRETEITLGTGALLAIGGGLVLLCGLCFSLGYGIGQRGSTKAPVKTPQAATEQEPLQASGSIPKPSATVQTPVAQPEATTAASSLTASAPNSMGSAQNEVHPALESAGGQQGTANGAAQVVRPALSSAPAQALPQGQQFMVQIAAVSNPQDAEALVNALKKRNYTVVSKREPADNFIHVRIGPFATRPIAEEWRMKLLNDGYNAQVQP